MRCSLFFICFFLAGCSPNSMEDFHMEGEVCCRKLVGDLQQIESHEHLLKSEDLLKKKFEKLVDLLISAREFQQKHPDEIPLGVLENRMNNPLKEELKRIYSIEGGREIIERVQHEALLRLDAYEKSLLKGRK